MSYSRVGLRLAVSACMAVVCLAGVRSADAATGTVYVASNDPIANEILIFARDARGGLEPAGSVSTGGRGTGGGLGNQGGLVLSEDERFVYVVDAGSDSIGVLSVERDGLSLLQSIDSGGVRPVSLTLDRKLLYVVHAGGSAGAEDSVVGFNVLPDGALEQIPGSSRALSAVSTAPAQVGFSADGRHLLVTEKATNLITVFSVAADGSLGLGVPQPSAGATPFGFDVDRRGRVYVSEAFGGAPDASAVSSYELDASGTLSVIDASVPTNETAACWFVLGRSERFGYTTNTASGTLTGFQVDASGSIDRLDESGVTAVSGGGPIDVDLSRNGLFLYVLNSGDGTVASFAVDPADGSLTFGEAIPGLPVGANGLAAR